MWVGHTTVMAQLGTIRLLTDPVLTGRIAHLRRHSRVEPAALERTDAILISHAHLDHLHIPSLRLLPRTTTVIVPAGAGDLIARRGFDDVRERESARRSRSGTSPWRPCRRCTRTGAARTAG